MRKYKYLTDLGINAYDITSNFNPRDKRQKRWKKERKKYGFDERETWDLSRTFVEWLYSHLMMYKERAIVDLSYHHFTIDNKEYTQVEVIDKILDVCRDYLLSVEPDYKKISEAIKWFSEIFICMWW